MQLNESKHNQIRLNNETGRVMTDPLVPEWDPAKTLDNGTSTAPTLTLIHGGHSDPQMPLPLQWQIAPGVPVVRPIPPATTHGLPTHIEVINDQGFPTTVPHPVYWASHMARMVFEVGCGERPSAQLNKWVSREPLTLLALRGQSYARHPATRAQKGLSRLRKVSGVRAMQVAPGIIEASAVLVGTARSHAVAMRMEAQGSQWMLTAVEMR
jgi:hypothetical protein